MAKLFYGKNGVDMVIVLSPFIIATVTSVGFIVYSIILLPYKAVQACLKRTASEEGSLP